MANNDIINNCCSVDDLRSYLRNLSPQTEVGKKKALENLQDAIEWERFTKQNRVSIINAITAKINAIKKTLK